MQFFISVNELELNELQSVISGRNQQHGSQEVGFEVGGGKKAQSIEGDGGLITVGPITTHYHLKKTWLTKKQKYKTTTSLNI